MQNGVKLIKNMRQYGKFNLISYRKDSWMLLNLRKRKLYIFTGDFISNVTEIDYINRSIIILNKYAFVYFVINILMSGHGCLIWRRLR